MRIRRGGGLWKVSVRLRSREREGYTLFEDVWGSLGMFCFFSSSSSKTGRKSFCNGLCTTEKTALIIERLLKADLIWAVYQWGISLYSSSDVPVLAVCRV